MTQLKDQALRVGTQIGVYEVKSVLNTSQFSITYCAINHHINSLVALKEYLPRKFAVRCKNSDGVEPKSNSVRKFYDCGLASFVEHANLLAQIEHPGIVGVHNALQYNSTAYLIMDYEDGIAVSKYYDSPISLTEPRLINVLQSLLEALEKVHEYGCVHGDVHPTNILVRNDGNPVFVGFKSSWVESEIRNGEGSEELRAGYVLAEWYDQDDRALPAADLYALGASMFRFIKQADPVSADDRISAIRNGEPDPLTPLLISEGHKYSESLLKTIDWLLCPEKKDRPQSATDVLTLLNSKPSEDQSTEALEQRGGYFRQTMRNAIRSNARLWLGGAFAIVILSGVGLWYLKGVDNKPETIASIMEKSITADSVDENMTPSIANDPEDQPGLADFAASDPELETEISVSLGGGEHEVIESTETVTVMDTELPQITSTESITNFQQEEESAAAKEDDTVKLQLATAQQHLSDLRLTTPANDNAYQLYMAVLAIQPDNAEAREGLEQIVGRYVWFITNSIKEKNYKRARIYLNRAETVLPDAPGLNRLRAKLIEIGQ